MKARKWTQQDVARLLEMRAQLAHTEDIAKLLDRTDGGIRLKLTALGFSSANVRTQQPPPQPKAVGAGPMPAPPCSSNSQSPHAPAEPPAEPPSVESNIPEFEAEVRDDLAYGEYNLLQAENRLIRGKYAQLLRQRSFEERWLELVRSRTEIFNPPAAPVMLPSADDDHLEISRESAVLLLSDTHIGQIVSVEETGGFGGYNIRRYCECLAFLEQSVIAAVRERSGGGVRTEELVVFLLGDLLHGCLGHGAEREQTLLIADQFQLAVWTLHQFLSRLASLVPRLRIYAAVGNHGRLPSQRKMPTVGRFSNFDFLLYAALEHSLCAEQREKIEFYLNASPRQIVQVQSARFCASHGDHLRGGDKQVGLPVAAVGREVNITAQRHAAARQAPIDYFLVGDKHRHGSLPLATGSYIFNGAFPGADEFSAYNFPPSEPVQILFWMHPEKRKTWQYDVKLRFAPALDQVPYELPSRIRYLVDQYGPAAPTHNYPNTQC